MSLLTKPLCSIQHRLSAPLFCSTVQHILQFLCSASLLIQYQFSTHDHNCFCSIYIYHLLSSFLSQVHRNNILKPLQNRFSFNILNPLPKWISFSILKPLQKWFSFKNLCTHPYSSNHHYQQLLSISHFRFIITVNLPARILFESSTISGSSYSSSKVTLK